MVRSISQVVIPIDANGLRRRPPLRWVRTCDSILIYGSAALLIFGVLAFGAVETWSIFGLEAGAAVLFATWVIRQIGGRTVRISAHPLYVPALLFFLAVVAQLAMHRSAYSYITQYELGKYIAYGVLLFLGGECFRTEVAARKLVVTLTTFGGLYAAFAIIQGLEGNGKLYWVRAPKFTGWIYGSYVHHGHYAGLVEMLVPIVLILGISNLLRPPQRVLVLFSGCVMVTSIFLSASRGGMLSLLAQTVMAGLLLSLASEGRKRISVLPLVSIVMVVAALVAIGSRGQVFARIGEVNVSMRGAIVRDVAHMWKERPVLGWGLGTFETVYPRFRSFFTTANVNAAHNDYAQVVADLGLIGGVLTLWFIVALYRHGRPQTWDWQTNWRDNVQFAAVIACTGILVHSLGDFNLQIPANAAMFYFLAGIAASPYRPESQPDGFEWEWNA